MRIRGAAQASEAGASSLRFFRFSRRFPAAPWDDKALVRDERFGAERLELHAASLAAAQPVTGRPPAVLSLHARLDTNASVLLAAYRENAKELENGRRVVPAAEWLLDNYHLVEEQIREIRDDLPPGFYRQLPRLTQGPFAGYPRVFGLAWAFVAHTDSNLDPDILARFIRAYQRVQPLTIGELWAVAITLRIVLIENLRRMAEQISVARVARAQADTLANRLVLPGGAWSALQSDPLAGSTEPLPQSFAAQLAKRLRDQDPRTTPAVGWLEDRLELQGASIAQVVQNEQQEQGASNVTVRNIITSMRVISDIDWAEWFEGVSLVDDRLRAASAFGEMDFPTRDLYRNAIEHLGRGSSYSELEITSLVLESAAQAAAGVSDPAEAKRVGDPGFHLIAEGRKSIEQKIEFRPSIGLRVSRFNLRLGVGGYVGASLLITAALLLLAAQALSAPGIAFVWFGAFALIAFLPASEVALVFVNSVVTRCFGAISLPALEFKDGIPLEFRTLVAVPALLTNETDVLAQVEQLEVHHLASVGGEITFALLLDGLDADQAEVAGDAELLESAMRAVDDLNSRYSPGPVGDRFLLLHRRRLFNEGENKWMGWERKRGKLHELNRLLRGANDTSFAPIAGRAPWVPPDVRYVITLDADTRLPRNTALRLIGKMAHPLNRPRFDDTGRYVVSGYAILQPRVTSALPISGRGSLYQKVSSGPAGMDPYAATVSDVYQDLFGEGSYTGKGIYDVDAFEAALHGRIPENALLSHDLFEGTFARSGLASDIEVVEEAPTRYDVVARRKHRWTRGDWQLLPWIFGPTLSRDVPPIGRAKMLDNLRRSMIAPSLMLTLVLCWLLPMPSALIGTLFAIATIAIPAFLPTVFIVIPHRLDICLRNHLRLLWAEFKVAVLQILFSVSFLSDRAWLMADAGLRTLMRLFVTRRHLLEWTTAAQAADRPRLDLAGFYRDMVPGLMLGVTAAVGAAALRPSSWPIIVPFAFLWLAAPTLAWWSSRPRGVPRRSAVSPSDARALRLTARRTWRFFETFVTPADNMLPPDNFQERPRPVVAQRTSPTNIGLYFLATVAARDFGWTGLLETVERLEVTFESMRKLSRFNGHFFNWYGTRDLQVLEPPYISSVDSGNFAGHLIALANACDEWQDDPLKADIRLGMLDCLRLAREAIGNLPIVSTEHGQPLPGILDEIEARLLSAQPIESLSPMLKRLADKAGRSAPDIRTDTLADETPDVLYWTEALGRLAVEHARDGAEFAASQDAIKERLRVLAAAARETALAMDFEFLLDPDRKLFSIGYSVTDSRLDTGCYDLLASEARLASLFAIAKGDVASKHWFRLGRSATPTGTGSALISWSGSMFEYLMPSLVMRAPRGSLLEQTNRLIVHRQITYARKLGVPWGISESAYNARDMDFTYQYSNFGVPGLGLKRGLADNLVIAPYATGLATMVDPKAASENFRRLAGMGARGRYGFYEALDFTRSRLPEVESHVIVRNYMAHHQGMTIVGIANTLHRGRMRTRFHREPMIQACDLLLQERMPRDVAVAHPRAEAVKASATGALAEPPTARRIIVSSKQAPVTHLLSNGRYAVMLTATGAGYSRWGDVAVTRWREDATRDCWGSFVFLRDMRSGKLWSAGLQPTLAAADHSEVVFGEDDAAFNREEGPLTTTMDVLVSGEDDGEVRRVTLTNVGRRLREIELTSYAELALAPASADDAHPAFSKMFVVTEYLAEFGAIVATRRPRSPDERQVWAVHFTVVEGDVAADPQFESDRARFLGRGRSLATAEVIVDSRPLSNTVGTVLDPIFSIRQRVSVGPGQIARVAFWTMMASSREELLALVDKHHDRSAFERAKTFSWTQAQVQLRHLGVDASEAADFQRLAAPILYADSRFRAPSDAIVRGAQAQSTLWRHSISGDLPIVLLRIDDLEDIDHVRQLLRASEYWRMKQLAVDIVIINERASSYVQDLQIAIETAVRSNQLRPRIGGERVQGSIHVLRADLISADARSLLHSVARVMLFATRGPIASQLARVLRDDSATTPSRFTNVISQDFDAFFEASTKSTPPAREALEFFNGLGGFAKDGREYVTILSEGATTPAPWINVISNDGFGFQASAEGSGYTWAGNSRENQLTPWSNDPVTDPSAEILYVRDEASGALWTATAQPIRDTGTYVARHGFGYSRFEHEADGIGLSLLQYVPVADPIKISRLVLRNRSQRSRRLSVTAYAEWVLGTSRGASAPFILTELDGPTGALLARKPWDIVRPDRVAFADLCGQHTAWTADRTEFLGRNGTVSAPLALAVNSSLSGAAGAGLDPCAALQRVVELGVDESIEIVWFIGQCQSVDTARALILKYRATDLDAVLEEVADQWQSLLSSVQVRTPDRAMDIMLNGWLLYQTLACRIRARSAFYQASGAYGFRDQLQDGMALTFARPDETRTHLLRAAGRQFVEGDVQHWWLPHSGQGVRTRISDDRVWLGFAAATYVACSGDAAILDEMVPFLEGPELQPGEHDAFFQPMVADESASLFEHCARGLDQCLELTGNLGLPLIGGGDWNDGMNRVGIEGKGESVWLGWLLLRTIELFAPLAEGRGTEVDAQRAGRWRAHAESLRSAIELHAWDGEWYRRATFDDGTWLGSSENLECRIDSIAQTWAVLSGAAEPSRAAQAMTSVERHLIRAQDKLALLFVPPFDQGPRDPGYIKGYPPGLRENGGQYSHAAMWVILAFVKLGAGDKAANLFSLLNPINHASTPDAADRYKVEPYVVTADVYSVAPHAGRGGWSWYTGSAGWMYRAGVEGILGIRREADVLVVDPCIPPTWPGFEADIDVRGSRYRIQVRTPSQRSRIVSHALLDGRQIACDNGHVRVPLDGQSHDLLIAI